MSLCTLCGLKQSKIENLKSEMKNTILIIATLSICLITIVLGSYFDALAGKEKMQTTQVHIYPMVKTFIMPDEVTKLIKIKDSTSKNIDVIDLEKSLEQNDYIRNAEVYKDLNGHLVAEVDQFHPIARIFSPTSSYYLDENGVRKPLSEHYTEKVVLVYGAINSGQKNKIINLIKKIDQDKFLNDIVSEIHIKDNGIWLRTSQLSADIKIDLKENLSDQFYKLKAIYTYLVKRQLKNKYRQIDLRFENQAVCK